MEEINYVAQNILPINIEEQMKTAYIDYSMSVIVGRALPDARDGMKPVHRRILFAMKELGISYHKAHKKSARIVGEVLGKYHPHGDTAVYDAMARMAQDWSMRYTLIDGQGNFGNQDGDGPAAMRYTEARLQKLAEQAMTDLEKNTVDFQFNFDDTLKEPTVLPTRIPQLLINGSSGIAVGMATNMMPHNFTEVIDACIAYVENKDISIDDLMKYVKAPDFPTGGIIFGIEGIKQAMHTGRGKVVLRGKVTIESKPNGHEQIIISEVPYQVNRDQLCNHIGELVNGKNIEGISNINNESNRREGTRIVIDVKRDAMASLILNQLYKYTELQTSYGINNVALIDGRPKTLNLKELIAEFIRFRHEVVFRRTKFELAESEKRAHILQGYMIAINNLDAVIALIKKSPNPETAKAGLIAEFEMSEIQAKAVLELRLQRLTGMEINKIKEEYDNILKYIAELKYILEHEEKRFAIIKEELIEVKANFGDQRKTEIQYLANEISIEDLIKKEDVVITISHLGYIKRTSIDEYRSQKRGGRGSKGARTREEDWVEHLFIASTHNTLLIFTEQGRCYWIKVYEIPETDKIAKGRAIQNLLQLAPEDNIRAVINVPTLNDEEFIKNHYVVLGTKRGLVKKTALSEFSRPRQTGVNAITILENDQLLEALLTDGNSEIMMALKQGKAIKFKENNVRPTGRGAQGVTGIDMDDNDEVVGMIAVSQEKNRNVLVVSEKGFGKQTPISEYRLQKRAGSGVKTINITDKTGTLMGIIDIADNEDLMIICKSGIAIRIKVTEIREVGRATQGVRLIKISNNDQIAAITRVVIEEEEENTEEVDISENVEGENIEK
ncbi:MAG: DNA gyrase subunit A [Chitinophagaceae bacterium]